MLPVINHLQKLFDNRVILSNYLNNKEKLNNCISLFKPPFIIYILIPSLVAIFFSFIEKRNDKLSRSYNNLILISIWYLVPVLFLSILSLLNIVQLLFPRYLVLIIPAPIIASVLIIDLLKSKWARMGYLTILLFLTQIWYPNSVLLK